LSGPALFGPVDDDDGRKDVVDDLSTVLPMSVAGKKTFMQGTLTCFFRVGNELYAICARHNFFKDGEDDDEYTFVDCMFFLLNPDTNSDSYLPAAGPRKGVIVMGPGAFANYLASICAKFRNLEQTVEYLVVREEKLAKKVEADPGDDKWARKLQVTQGKLAELRDQVSTLKAFHSNVMKYWSNMKERIIGHVVWAPKIDVNVSPYDYTQDFCVIHLDKEKFKDGFLGNTLSLGAYTDHPPCLPDL